MPNDLVEPSIIPDSDAIEGVLLPREEGEEEFKQLTIEESYLLSVLAEQVNFFEDQIKNIQRESNKEIIKTGVKAGLVFKKITGMIGTGKQFIEWLKANNCVGRTRAFSYINLSKEYEYLLKDGVQLSEQKWLQISHEIALLNAPTEYREEVRNHVAKGGKVTVSEINAKLKESKKAEKNAEKQAKEAKAQLEQAQLDLKEKDGFINQLKADSDAIAEIKAKEKLKELESQLIKSVTAELTSDFQPTIDELTDKVSELRNKLAIADGTADKERIQKEIADLEQVRKTQLQEEYNRYFKDLAKKISDCSAELHLKITSYPVEEGAESLNIDAENLELLLGASEVFDACFEAKNNLMQSFRFHGLDQ